MSFGIIRAKKITSFGAMVGVAMHNFREREVSNADEKKKDQNVYWRAKTHEELLLGTRKILDMVDRKIQKNAVLGVEYLVTASPEFFEGRSREDAIDFFQKSLVHLKRKHGSENVVSASIHFDEKTPHLHVVLVPVLKKEKKVTNPKTKETRTREVVSLDSGHWFGGREKMKKLQTDFFEEVSKPFGLERGNEGAKATHQDIARWYEKKHKEEAEGRLAPPTPPREKIAGEFPLHSIRPQTAEIGNFEKYLEKISFDDAEAFFYETVETVSNPLVLDAVRALKGDTKGDLLLKASTAEFLNINRDLIAKLNDPEVVAEIRASALRNAKALSEFNSVDFQTPEKPRSPENDRGR